VAAAGRPSDPTVQAISSGRPTHTGASSVGAVMRPVEGSGRDVATEIRMAPGPDGRLWVSIPGKGGVVVTLLDDHGAPSPGWPIRLPDVDGCDRLLPVDDATLRIVCSVKPPSGGPYDSVARAYAFDANGQRIAGWPVDTANGSGGIVDGSDLVLLADPLLQNGGEGGEQWSVAVVRIRKDGTPRKGVDALFTCCDTSWMLGPDGIAYGLTRRYGPAAGESRTDVLAVGPDGPREGWPVTIDGITSDLAFGAGGHGYAAVSLPGGRTTRTVVLDAAGHVLPASSAGQAIVSTNLWDGAGADEYPGPPIVAIDGTAFIVEAEASRTTVVGLDPSGKPLPGWPYRSTDAVQWSGECGSGDTGCGWFRQAPQIGPSNALYLLNEAAGSSTGGSIVAIGADGLVRDGWPVGLRRAGSAFSSVVIAPSGIAWALVTEPEKKGSSATILAIAEDSTVLWTTTIVEP
jgi:hypothetical protein